MSKSDVVQGTLDMLILKTLALEPMHGFGIGQRIEQTTEGVFVTGPGSFFPSLRRLERKGLIKGEWGLSENNRRARYYSLTGVGRRRLDEEVKNWRKIIFAVDQVLGNRRIGAAGVIAFTSDRVYGGTAPQEAG